MASARTTPSAPGDRWDPSALPDQSGRTALVTGASSGIGLAAALALARAGATVRLACRDAGRGSTALARLLREVPRADAAVELVDLADLSTVRDLAARWDRALDVLVNNAGVMAPPRRLTQDGFELQLGTNHLGHFALTGLLLPWFVERPGARVVTVSSLAHLGGAIDFADLQSERSYHRWPAYAQSKLANLLFAAELDRRLAGHAAVSVAAHPGFASTNLQTAGLLLAGGRLATSLLGTGLRLGTRLVSQSAAHGAWPTLYAATAPDVVGGEYVGPGALGGTRGRPTRAQRSPAAADPLIAERLWEVSEGLTGVTYGL
jgi:NAD(P)-dependent dehydrogenase (short-subunit alcohol dehydrogenase family)